MRLESIITDWKEYGKRKRKYADAYFFDCREEWEVEYLINKIQEFHRLHKETIRTAIQECCRMHTAPLPRREFVMHVLTQLALEE